MINNKYTALHIITLLQQIINNMKFIINYAMEYNYDSLLPRTIFAN